ncbi:MAG: endonuclease/exonuclease/phosphatase family protein [Planctomycetota bacterium]
MAHPPVSAAAAPGVPSPLDKVEGVLGALRGQGITEEQASFPVVVAGDLNALPDSRGMLDARAFLDEAYDSSSASRFTFSADKPDRRIDYIFYGQHPALKCVDCRVIPEAIASDHRPVLATFEVDAE